MITILSERIVVAPVPEIAEVGNDIIDLVVAVVRYADRDRFLKNETGRVALLDDDDAGALFIVATVRELVAKDADGSVIETEA